MRPALTLLALSPAPRLAPLASPRAPAVQCAFTCRICKATYDADTNGPRACRSHPGMLRGESARKGNWEGVAGPDTGSGGDLVYTWSCCGAPADDPGCTHGFHASYDDDGGGGAGRAPAPRMAATPTTDDTGEVLAQSYFAGLDYSTGGIPWDLRGRPQPPVVHAAEAGAFGPVGTRILDCGCGAGDNAAWLAARGYDCLGFDTCPSALETARARASAADATAAISAAGGRVEFVRASAMELRACDRVVELSAELGGFEVALDSALLHCLDDDAQRDYVLGLRTLLRRGGSLYAGVFSDANPDPWSNPRRMSEAQLRELFCAANGWCVASIESCWYARPSERSDSSGGAWTMAWWCKAEAV